MEDKKIYNTVIGTWIVTNIVHESAGDAGVLWKDEIRKVGERFTSSVNKYIVFLYCSGYIMQDPNEEPLIIYCRAKKYDEN